MAPSRRGQNTVEYMLLLCSVLIVISLAGAFLKNYVPMLLDRLADQILSAVIELAAP